MSRIGNYENYEVARNNKIMNKQRSNLISNNLIENNENNNIQNQINNSLKKRYFIEKYLGTKDNNHNYLANDAGNSERKYLIQVRPINKLDNNSLSQIAFLNYLSRFQTSRKYIRPCLDFGITQNNIILVHQFNQEQSLGEYLEKIKDLKPKEYLETITKLIGKILYSLSYIHRKGVVHQNFDFENILIRFEPIKNNNQDKEDFTVIFTDFQYSCGHYLSEQDKKIHSQICSPKFSPIEETYKEELLKKIEEVIEKEDKNKEESDQLAYLYLAKKYDIYLLGVLFWKMINRPKVGVNPILVEYNHEDLEYHGISHQGTINLNKFVVENLLSKIPNRLKAKEALDELVLKSKYGFN